MAQVVGLEDYNPFNFKVASIHLLTRKEIKKKVRSLMVEKVLTNTEVKKSLDTSPSPVINLIIHDPTA